MLHGEGELVLHHPRGVERVVGPDAALEWLAEVIDAGVLDRAEALEVFPGDLSSFASGWAVARRAGLVAV